jgi:hypothetical protein
MAGRSWHPDPATRVILGELRELRREAAAERRTAQADRRQAEAGRREWRQSQAEWRQSEAEWREERRRSDERFDRLIQDFEEDSRRREAVTQKAFGEIRAVGLSIVKTLNRHTKILEEIARTLGLHTRLLRGIDRKLGARDDGGPSDGHARGA